MNIRLATEADASAVTEIYAPIVANSSISFEQVIPDSAEMASRIRHTLQRYPWLMGELDGRVAGYAYASTHRKRGAYQWSVDVTVYVHPDFRRRGVGRVLYEALFSVLRRQGFFNAYAAITTPNAGSIGLHKAVGFTLVGVYERVGYKLGRWRDVGWWRLVLAEPVAAPKRPCALAELGVLEF